MTSGGTASRDIDAPLLDSNKLVHSHALELKPVDRSKLKGIIEKTAADVGGLDVVLKNGTNRVGPRKIPGQPLSQVLIAFRIKALTMVSTSLLVLHKDQQDCPTQAIVKLR